MSTEDLQNSLDGLGTAIQNLADREAPAVGPHERARHTLQRRVEALERHLAVLPHD